MLQIILSVGFCVLMLGVMAGTRIWQKRSLKKIYEDLREKDYSYTLLIRGFSWGPCVDRIILAPGDCLDSFEPADFEPDSFGVTVCTERYGEDGALETFSASVPVLSACPCDIDGNPLDDDADSDSADGNGGGHILLTLKCGPDMQETNPFIYSPGEARNMWKEKFDFTVEHKKLPRPVTECSDWYCSEADRFETLRTGNELTACAWEPEKDGKKHPLIVWLHGAGEGGTDPMIAVLGNQVTALSGNGIQSYFDGAYILCPQTPTVWMQNGDRPYDIMAPECTDKRSRYTRSCKKIIDSFISHHPDIDRRRIYIGGCSNGGYMTVNMLLCYPGFFAAAFPVCEAYCDSWLSGDDIRTLDSVPLWFVASRDDEVVDPRKNAVATVRRLESLGGSGEVHMSLFDGVRDSYGKYNGHWSWIYLFNDECVSEDDESLWGWLSRQEIMEND